MKEMPLETGSGKKSSTTSSFPKITFGYTWLAAIPAGAWAISTIYIPLFSEHLSPLENWAVTLTTLLLIGVSVFCHVFAHLFAARILQSEIPDEQTIFIFGDAAQSWPMSASNWNDFLIASAGPLANVLLGGFAFLLWNAQVNAWSHGSGRPAGERFRCG